MNHDMNLTTWMIAGGSSPAIDERMAGHRRALAAARRSSGSRAGSLAARVRSWRPVLALRGPARDLDVACCPA